MKVRSSILGKDLMASTPSTAKSRLDIHWLMNYNSSCRWIMAAVFASVLLVAEPSEARLNQQPPETPEVSFFEPSEFDPAPEVRPEESVPSFWEKSLTTEEEAKIIRDMNDANLHQKLELMAKFPDIRIEELFSSSDYGGLPAESNAYAQPEPAERQEESLADYGYEPSVDYYLNQEYSPEDYTLQDYTAPDYTQQDYAPQEYTSQEYMPQEYTPQDHTPQEYTPEKYTPQEYAPQEYAPQEYASQEYASQEYAPFYDSPTFYQREAYPYSNEEEGLYGRMLFSPDAEASSRRLPKRTVLAEVPKARNWDTNPKAAELLEDSSETAGSFADIKASPSSGNTRVAPDSNLRELVQQIISPDLIRHYSKSVREGGIEGRVISEATKDVKYATPTVLQEAIHSLFRNAEDAIRRFSDSSLHETLQRVVHSQQSRSKSLSLSARLSIWKNQSPWITLLSNALETGCSSGWRSAAQLDKVGNPEDAAVFPNCFINYIERLPSEQKHHMGKLIRAEMQNLNAIKKVFDPQEGICSLVAGALPQLSATSFCEDLRDVLVSTAYFIPLATKVQEAEVEEYGEGFSMMELTAASDARLKMQAKLSVFKLYRFWALSPLVEEAKHLLRVWVNDPVHKWRYVMGLYQWVTAFGLWLGELAVDLEPVSGAQ